MLELLHQYPCGAPHFDVGGFITLLEEQPFVQQVEMQRWCIDIYIYTSIVRRTGVQDTRRWLQDQGIPATNPTSVDVQAISNQDHPAHDASDNRRMEHIAR